MSLGQVVRGLSQVEATPEMPAELKASWNAWALKLCETENGSAQLRSKCARRGASAAARPSPTAS